MPMVSTLLLLKNTIPERALADLEISSRRTHLSSLFSLRRIAFADDESLNCSTIPYPKQGFTLLVLVNAQKYRSGYVLNFKLFL